MSKYSGDRVKLVGLTQSGYSMVQLVDMDLGLRWDPFILYMGLGSTHNCISYMDPVILGYGENDGWEIKSKSKPNK